MDDKSFDAGRLHEAVQAFLESAGQTVPQGVVAITIVVPVDAMARLKDASAALHQRLYPGRPEEIDETD